MANKYVQIVGVPFDQKSSFLRGSERGPAAIREALYDGSSSFLIESDRDLLVDQLIKDLGNLEVDGYQSIGGALENIPQKPTIFIGGDHSISFPLVQWAHHWSDEFDILHFDAHTDLYDQYQGDPYSHACPFARIMESGLTRRLVQVGIRTINRHQQNQIDRFGVELVRMSAIDQIWNLRFERPLYISLDLDVFDPGFAPGVSHYEPGGMTPRMCIDFLGQLTTPIVCADIVELNPVRDHHGITAHLAAKLLKELVGKMI